MKKPATDISAFIANGGKITKAAKGQGLNLTNRDWRAVVRGGQPEHGSNEWLWEMGFAAEAKERVRG